MPLPRRCSCIEMLLTASVTLFGAGPAGAQSQAVPAPAASAPPSATVTTPLQPSAPHERLSFFEGSWTVEDARPEDQFREDCAWLPEGRRHMVCRSRWTTPTGPRAGLSLFSFDAPTGDYLYHGLRSGGAVVAHRGRPHEGGWLFSSQTGAGDARIRHRVTITPRGEGGFVLVDEQAVGERPFEQKARVVYLRMTP